MANETHHYCNLPTVRTREFDPSVHPDRVRLILVSEKKWVNGTQLRYYFFDQNSDGKEVVFGDGSREWRTWQGSAREKDAVREAFQIWKSQGMGLEFIEVTDRREEQIRIGFMEGDGAWSYVGRDVLNISKNARTMNFGWNIIDDIDTAVHEIGHTLGFPHEHQNPNAGIVWDEEAVYEALAKPPNRWSRETTEYNIIRKIAPDDIQGSDWDPNSVMHYPFQEGMILQPIGFRDGLSPNPGLSARDKVWVKHFYPSLDDSDETELIAGESQRMDIDAGQQKDFVFNPESNRRYRIQTFGDMDTVMVMFEREGTELTYLSGDDDSGEDRNAYMRIKLKKRCTYVIRIRLYYKDSVGATAVMIW